MSKRDDAIQTLQHYFALAMGKKRAMDLSSDSRMEIESIVDDIIDAAVSKLRAEMNPTAPAPARTDTFKTDDGYTLRWSNENLSWFTGKTWEDRDMEFPANGDGLPLDHMGEPLDGAYIEEE